MLTLVEYVLLVPDSIARPPGRPACLLASDSGTCPRIEPNHTQAGLFTTVPLPHPPRHSLLMLSWLGGWPDWQELRRWRPVSVAAVCRPLPLQSRRHQLLPSSNHSAFEVLGLGASTGAGHRLNLLVVGREGVEQFLAKDGRLLRLKHLEYHDLILEGALGAGVGWKSRDAVRNNPVGVTNRLGGNVVGWLVFAGLDGRELLMQQHVKLL
jgi:hypothetical protein